MRQLIYIAAPLFSEAELSFNANLKVALSEFFEVYLPQEDGQLLVKLLDQGVPLNFAKKSIFTYDMAAIEKADILLIVMDGRTPDEGAAFELGAAYTLGKKCIALQTDPRRLLPSGNNPMLDCALSQTFCSRDDLMMWARAQSESSAPRRLI